MWKICLALSSNICWVVVLTCCQLTPHLNSSVFMVMISALQKRSVKEHCDTSMFDSVDCKLNIYIPPRVLWWLPQCASRDGGSRLPSQRKDGHQNTSQTWGTSSWWTENSFVGTKSKLVFLIPPSSEASEALKLINSPSRVNSSFLQFAHFVPPENGKVYRWSLVKNNTTHQILQQFMSCHIVTFSMYIYFTQLKILLKDSMWLGKNLFEFC